MTSSRLFADRRRGSDRRLEARRWSITGVAAERRRVVDRRRGAERRSTLDRRNRPTRASPGEAPGEHLRNALQLLNQLAVSHELGDASTRTLAASIHRVRRALDLLESRRMA
ncbi:MAG TPA: hypothetical protein VEK85_09870 [Gemmatimonadales bacterium]|nr:hypothetical protein [Gemmatimonadales bacterium]